MAFADGTQSWTQTSYDDFSKGTAKGVALRSDGTLELAPAFKMVATTPSTFLWAIATDAEGNVYAAAGSPARVYRITADGKVTNIFEPKELQVQALAIDPAQKGVVYAATSPDGKIYKIERSESTGGAKTPPQDADKKAEQKDDKNAVPVDASYRGSVFFDPKTKYIWDMAFDANGKLFVATGDRGEIYAVDKSGSGAVFFKSDEAHIRKLAFDKQGSLIAGSDGSGLVYRISPAGEGFVAYSAPKKEITALAVDATGNIYAAGVGEKRGTGPGQVTVTIGGNAGGPMGMPMSPVLPQPLSLASGGSEVYMIAPDGSPKKIWSAKDDIVYALAFDAKGRILAATGNRGRIVAIEPNGDFVDLVKAAATQVTNMATTSDGAIYAASSNLGKIFSLSPKPEAEGTFESEVLDAHIFSKWGRVEVRGHGDYEVALRSGNVDNPDRNWSPWKKLDKTGKVEAPAARFLQWRVTMTAHDGKPSSELASIRVNYLPKNVAPVIDDITVQAGARFNNQSTQPRQNETVMVNVGQQPQQSQPSQRYDTPLAAQRDRGSVAIRWAAHDDNDDDLTYAIYYRGDGEARWKLLKDDVSDRFYSFDAALLPDGGYTVKIVASDSPSHTPEESLNDSRESARFEIDNTPPQVQNLAAKMDEGELHVTFTATDSFSNIEHAEYSLDAGPWQYIEPVGQLSDSPHESYDFNIAMPAAAVAAASAKKNKKNAKTTNGTDGVNDAAAPELSGEHAVVVRVYDRYDNVGASKVIVK
jgi:sugar lactone lactonase YvrE